MGGQLSESRTKPVSSPAPMTPVMDEFEYIRRLIKQEADGLAARAACLLDARTIPICVTGLKATTLSTKRGFGQCWELWQIVSTLEVCRRQSAAAEEITIVRYRLTCVSDRVTQQTTLILEEFIQRPPL
jgi:hypothetical protein